MTQAARNGRQTTVVVATHNEGKIVEIRSILEAAFGQLAQRIALVSAASLGLPDPVETGLTFAQNALLKAHAAARQSHMPALADDSGLVVDVLGAAPGILSARWSGTHGHDQANMDLLLGQLADIPDQGRTARFRCAAALVVPQEPAEGAGAPSDPESESESESVEFGEMPGMIAHEARGTGGFGYDPIFIPDEQPVRAGSAGRRLTSAEMTADEKNAISHRYRALHALVPAIERLLTLQA